jgi:hypothetical protein
MHCAFEDNKVLKHFDFLSSQTPFREYCIIFLSLQAKLLILCHGLLGKCAHHCEGFYKTVEDGTNLKCKRKSKKSTAKVDKKMYEIEVC